MAAANARVAPIAAIDPAATHIFRGKTFISTSPNGEELIDAT
jgi:hypothetical protein